MPNPSIAARKVSETSAFIRTDRQTDMARSKRLVILIKNMYTLWGQKRSRIYILYGTETFLSACYILSDEPSMPFYSTSNGYILLLYE